MKSPKKNFPKLNAARITVVILIVVIMGNLNAIIDLIFNPQLPYFNEEHIIVGGFTALLTACLLVALLLYNQRLIRAIYKQRETEEVLRRYPNIFKNAVEGIFQTTLDGKYLVANPALAKMFGYNSPEELVETVTDLNHQFYVDPNRREVLIQLIEKHGFVSNFESQVYCKDGSTIWVSENVRTLIDQKGNIIGFKGNLLQNNLEDFR